MLAEIIMDSHLKKKQFLISRTFGCDIYISKGCVFRLSWIPKLTAKLKNGIIFEQSYFESYFENIKSAVQLPDPWELHIVFYPCLVSFP